MQKIGIIGCCSKRYKAFYREILSKISYSVVLWNRSEIQYKANNNESIADSLDDMLSSDLDLVLCFLPAAVNFDFLKDLDIKCPVLIETPVMDQRWFNFNRFAVGVLEQWPYYPLEIFKRKVYESNLISKPYQLFNDGRSFDYHAIAQLRKINNEPKPLKCMGLIQHKKQPGFKDFTGSTNNTPDEWTYGMALMEDNTVIMYSFAYNCKKSILKPFQLIRHCSIDGSITSGRMGEIGNDYEMANITYLDGLETKSAQIKKICNKNDKLESIEAINDVVNIKWENKYSKLDLEDSQIAVAYMLDNVLEGVLYSPFNAFLDILMTDAMKQSAMTNQVIDFRNQ